MPSEALLRFLQQAAPLSQQQAAEIAARFRPKMLARSAFQLAEGKVCREYLFLEEGCMRAFAHDPGGADITVNFFTAGEIACEFHSFFNHVPSKENIVALTECRGWYLTFEELNELFHTLPHFREAGRTILVRGLTALKSRALSMITDSAESRYAALIANKPDIFQHVPLKHIASYVGVTDTSLSRIRKVFAQRGQPG